MKCETHMCQRDTGGAKIDGWANLKLVIFMMVNTQNGSCCRITLFVVLKQWVLKYDYKRANNQRRILSLRGKKNYSRFYIFEAAKLKKYLKKPIN